ncbi:MAG: alkane 1-monooxygenase, partial [Sulfitobacter sp.]|nr:alkane 1-monooxygenase [Sulfitobacter sp.]
SMQQAFVRLRTGQPGKLPRPVDDIDAEVGVQMRRAVDQALRVTAVGSPDSVRTQLAAMIERYQPDEMILTGQIHDHAARVKSFEIAADVLADLTGQVAA